MVTTVVGALLKLSPVPPNEGKPLLFALFLKKSFVIVIAYKLCSHCITITLKPLDSFGMW